MRLRIRKNSRLSWQDHDLGGGWKITREKNGSCVWWFGSLLNDDGYVVNRLYERFSYRRDAEAWVNLHKAILE